MVDATQAVQIAAESLNKVVPTFAALDPHVEEIQRSREDDSWCITFRAENPEPKSEKRGFGEIFFPYLEKVVRVNAESGELLSVLNPSYE